MSVRRLAEDSIQPGKFAFSKENAAWAEATIKKYPEGRQQSAVIPLLMRAQEQEGWVTKAAVEGIADMLEMPYIRALEVATFYTQFQLKPVGSKAHVQICGTTPCMLRGSEELISLCKKKINANPFDTNEAGTLSWEEVECQGACVNAPMVMIFKDTYEDLTPERLEEIIDAFEAGKGADIAPGPQNGRHLSAPVGGLTSLTDDQAVIGNGSNRKDGGSSKAARDDEPVDKGHPEPSVPPEGDPTIAEPAKARGTAGPAKSADESGGEPATPRASRSGKKAAPSTAPGRGNTAGKTAEAPDNGSAVDRPAAVEKPKQPDNLKLISGVGPKIEEKLHDLGVWTFAQIAEWKKAERAWVDEHLNFRGRIDRDDWVSQAKALAKGGEEEYERVFGKKPR